MGRLHVATAIFLCLAALAAVCSGQNAAPGPLSASEIMARVGANQDRSEAERTHYIYVQHTRMASQKGRTVLCEELTDYRMTPSLDGVHDELLKLDGRLRVKGKYVVYHSLVSANDAAQAKSEKDPDSGTINGDSADRQIVENIRANLMHDKSKDGINAHLFPLTSKEQANYSFTLAGRERMNGRSVYHITFRPKDKDDFGWKGDAYIDEEAFQPVLVTTGMARKIPFAVRTLLGTNVPGLGFTVVYAPQADGVWFPVSFSSEFKIHILYFFHRDVVLNAENRNFEKTHVTSRMLDGVTPAEPEKP